MSLFSKIRLRAKQLKQEVIVLSLAFKDKRTPFIAKLLIGLTISYALSPVDLIPDFIPVLGYVDDLIILPLMVVVSLKLIPKSVIEDCRKRVNSNIRLNKKAGMFSAIAIVLVWILLAGILIHDLVMPHFLE